MSLVTAVRYIRFGELTRARTDYEYIRVNEDICITAQLVKQKLSKSDEFFHNRGGSEYNTPVPQKNSTMNKIKAHA